MKQEQQGTTEKHEEEHREYHEEEDKQDKSEEKVKEEKATEEKKAQETQGKKEQNASGIKKQWDDLKAKHPDALLLFRIGDFYEMYNQDARKGSEILGITLTKRASGNIKEMAGFPFHALDTYLPKLIREGQRVAICDMLEEPKRHKQEEVKELVEPSRGMKR